MRAGTSPRPGTRVPPGLDVPHPVTSTTSRSAHCGGPEYGQEKDDPHDGGKPERQVVRDPGIRLPRLRLAAVDERDLLPHEIGGGPVRDEEHQAERDARKAVQNGTIMAEPSPKCPSRPVKKTPRTLPTAMAPIPRSCDDVPSCALVQCPT
jgi:hypothetical protein